MKYSIVVTVFNEEKTIEALLESMRAQNEKVSEIVIVDGGSKDQTTRILRRYARTHPQLHLKVLIKKGNRSVGRNFGVKKSTGNIILFTDAGCLLDQHWVKEITKPFKNKNTQVVAGYYKGKSDSSFQKALIPYVLVMPDKIDKRNFLPATRSMAIDKETFLRLGGFEEKYAHNEDYVLANKIKDAGIRIDYAKRALAIWIPRTTPSSTFRMFYRFALGDIESGIVRGKVMLLFLRYLLFVYLLVLSYLYKNLFILVSVIVLSLLYLVWAFTKHKMYLGTRRSRAYSGFIQLISDVSVMIGSLVGALKYLLHQTINFVKTNKLASFVMFIYIVLILSVIDWGLPSISHPFVYHMDEWHFLNAIRSVALIGDPNIEGSAHTAMLYPFSSGIFLIPFILLKIISPFSVQSPFSDFEMQKRIFEVLRIHTMISGIIAITVSALISRIFIKIPSWILGILLSFSPIFLSLSVFYKYDITLMATTFFGCLLMFFYSKTGKIKDFYLASFIWGLTFATKFTASPLFVLILLGYFLFTRRSDWRIKEAGTGLMIFFLAFLLFGIPNLFFGKGNLNEYFYSNLVSAPGVTTNIIFPYSFWLYMATKQFFGLLGIGLSTLIVLSIPYYIVIIWNGVKNRNISKYSRQYFSLGVFFVFTCSLIPLKVAGGGNRSLVVVSGALLIVGYFLKYLLSSKMKNILFIFLPILLFVQIIQGYSWIDARNTLDPRQSSSRWINTYIQPNTKIGIENIPIYQYIPDIALREYYQKQVKINTKYNFEVIDAKTKNLPSYIIISSKDISPFIKSSSKNDLLFRLKKEQYIKIAEFSPKLPFFMNSFDFYIANIGPVFPVAQIAIFKKD